MVRGEIIKEAKELSQRRFLRKCKQSYDVNGKMCKASHSLFKLTLLENTIKVRAENILEREMEI